MPRFNKLLVTGAAGNLGRVLRKGLAPLATTICASDINEMEPAGENEETVVCDLGDFDAIMKLVEGCDGVVHFGASSVERPWAEILNSAIIGGYNVYEAARKNGIKRVVYASSIHAVGYVRREEGADTGTPHCPDSLYGVSKCFVEDLAQLYFRKFGIESACLRINTSIEEPKDRRHLATWLSYDDLIQLVSRCLVAERIGFSIAYGISNNQECFFSNDKVKHIGFEPKDSSEMFRQKVEANTRPGDPHDRAVEFVGGVFCNMGHPDDSEPLDLRV